MESKMNQFACMFTNQVCFKKIIHTGTSNIDHVDDLFEFIKDFDAKDKHFLLEHAPEAEVFLNKETFDREDVVDFTDFFRRVQIKYPFLIKLSAFIPQNFTFKDDGSISSYNFSDERKTQWILVNSLEHASNLAIKFSEQILTETCKVH